MRRTDAGESGPPFSLALLAELRVERIEIGSPDLRDSSAADVRDDLQPGLPSVLERGLRRPLGLTRPHPTIEELGDGRVVTGADATVLDVEDQRGERLVDVLLPGLGARCDKRARHAPLATRVRIDAA